MKQQVSPKIFYAVIALVCLAVGVILYRQATDPLYHNDPDEEAARRQFTKPAPAAPVKDTAAPKSDESARSKDAAKPNAKSEPAGKNTPASPSGP